MALRRRHSRPPRLCGTAPAAVAVVVLASAFLISAVAKAAAPEVLPAEGARGRAHDSALIAAAPSATYRNAYGTRFQCSSFCVWLLVTHTGLLATLLLLLFLVPVQRVAESADKASAPIILRFGSSRASNDNSGIASGELEATSSPPQEVLERRRAASVSQVDLRYRFQTDVTQQLSATTSIKTYASVVGSIENEVSERQQQQQLGQEQEPQGPDAPLQSHTSERRPSNDTSSPSEQTNSDPPNSQSQPELHPELHARSVAEKAEEVHPLITSHADLEDVELDQEEHRCFVRELQAGLAIKKVCQTSGKVVRRTLFLSSDRVLLFWRTAGRSKRPVAKSSLRVASIQHVHSGLHEGVRKAPKMSSERAALCLSVSCSDGKRLALETPDETARQRLQRGFSRLVQEAAAAARHDDMEQARSERNW